jgi:hypothetical protein
VLYERGWNVGMRLDWGWVGLNGVVGSVRARWIYLATCIAELRGVWSLDYAAIATGVGCAGL